MSDVSDLREQLAAAIKRARGAYDFFRDQCSAEARAYGDAVFAAVDAAHASLREQKPWWEGATRDERVSRQRAAFKTLSLAQDARAVAHGELAFDMNAMPYERSLYASLTSLADALAMVADAESRSAPDHYMDRARATVARLGE